MRHRPSPLATPGEADAEYFLSPHEVVVRRLLTAVLVALVVLLPIACGDRTEPTATRPRADVSAQAPTVGSINAQITALFPPQFYRLARGFFIAMQIERARGNLPLAQRRAIAFVSVVIIPRYKDGVLRDPNGSQPPTTEEAVLRLIRDLFLFVGLPAPDLPPSVLRDGNAALIDERGGTVVASTGFAGISLPPGAVDRPVLVSVARLPDPATPGTGPLPTTLGQFPLFYDVRTVPAVPEFNVPVRVGVCQVSDATSPFYPPEQIHDRLRLAHPDPADRSRIEILPLANVNDFLRCAGASVNPPGRVPEGLRRLGLREEGLAGKGWLLAGQVASRLASFVTPSPAYAVHGGVGGSVRSLSPFGAVDPGPSTGGPAGTAEDPVGDALPYQDGPSPDFRAGTARVADGTLTLTLDFAGQTFDRGTTLAVFSLDLDENPATGSPGVNAGGSDAQLVGADFIVNAGSRAYVDGAEVRRYAGTPNSFTLVGTAPVTFTDTGLSVSIPLDLLDGDDGRLNYKVTASRLLPTGGFTGVLDYMTDLGAPPAQVR